MANQTQQITVKDPGLATTIQDLGRNGYYHLGIPQGGALDQYSARVANVLVGNSEDSAVLECTYTGPSLEFDFDATIAVTGAPTSIRVDGDEQDQWKSFNINAGQTLDFGTIKAGARFYIAVRGGLDVPVVLGSRSTYIPGALGGIDGRKLETGDEIPCGDGNELSPVKEEQVAEEKRPEFSAEIELRIILGLYDHKLTEQGISNLTTQQWTLTPVADRAGMRFQGPGVEWKDELQPFGAGSDPSNIVDAGYAVGSIQIPGGTSPIVLHRDSVSGGGYAMVGTVISADMDKVARATPGTKTSFIAIEMEEALEARKVYNQAIQELDNLK